MISPLQFWPKWRRAQDLHDTREIAEPLPESDLLKQADPLRAGIGREFFGPEIHESQSDAATHDPITKRGAWFGKACLFEHCWLDTGEGGLVSACYHRRENETIRASAPRLFLLLER